MWQEELRNQLINYRKRKAYANGSREAYRVFNNAQLEDIVKKCPSTIVELCTISGFRIDGNRVKGYGQDIINICKEYGPGARTFSTDQTTMAQNLTPRRYATPQLSPYSFARSNRGYDSSSAQATNSGLVSSLKRTITGQKSGMLLCGVAVLMLVLLLPAVRLVLLPLALRVGLLYLCYRLVFTRSSAWPTLYKVLGGIALLFLATRSM